MADRNWQRIDKAPKGIGPLLLRIGTGSLDPAFIGYQADDGRWFSGDSGDAEVHPLYWCAIPLFDADDDGAAG
jgi:hypothetical protein